MNTAPIATERPTFTRISEKRRVTAFVKQARKAGYTVEEIAGLSFKVTDPTKEGVLVFRSVNMGRFWATTYAKLYFREQDDEASAVPAPAVVAA